MNGPLLVVFTDCAVPSGSDWNHKRKEKIWLAPEKYVENDDELSSSSLMRRHFVTAVRRADRLFVLTIVCVG